MKFDTSLVEHRSEALLRDFLRQNDDYSFSLIDFLESSRHISEVRSRFQSFCNSFDHCQSLPQQWARVQSKHQAALNEVPAYRSIDLGGKHYWSTIELIQKADVRVNPDLFLNPRFDRKKLWVRHSSGTTGRPFSVYYSPHFYFEFLYFAVCKIAYLAGMLSDEILQNQVFCLAIYDNKRVCNRVFTTPDGFCGLTVVSVIGDRSPVAGDSLCRLINEHQPAVVTIRPDVLETALISPIRLSDRARSHLRLIVSGGAVLADSTRTSAEDVFGVPVINAYGLSEVGSVAAECGFQSGLHIYESDVIAEVLTSDGILAADGAGELVVSSVANEAMPFLRYRTGDNVVVTSEPCQCGLMGRRIRNVIGRTGKTFLLPDGTRFSPTNFNQLFASFPVSEFRMTQLARDELSVEVQFTSYHDVTLVEAIKKWISERIRGTMNVVVVEVKFDPNESFNRYNSVETDAGESRAL